MIIYPILFIFVSCVLARKSKSCSNINRLPFTGYRIENQLNIKTLENEFYLLYCNQDRLISMTPLNNDIPWTKEINFGNRNLILARRKSYALRKLPLYFPDKVIGSLNIIDENINTESTVAYPLISDDILNNWLEITHNLDFIYHIPILSTPRLESKNYDKTFDWNKYIDLEEKYKFDYDPRSLLQVRIDSFIKSINQLFPINFSDPVELTSKVVFISKTISTKLALKIINSIDKLYTYDTIF